MTTFKFVGKMEYGILDDAYVYGTRNISKSSSGQHLNRDGADPKEVERAGLNTITTFFPSPVEFESALFSRFNVATFGSRFKGSFLTRLAPATRGTVIRMTNKAINQVTAEHFIKAVEISTEAQKTDK
jgi:hypothetical protein